MRAEIARRGNSGLSQNSLGARRARWATAGVTLLELATVIVIIAILFVLSLPIVEGIRARSERLKCTTNLKSLHVATTNYIQQNGHWPQINPGLSVHDHPTYAESWRNALRPFGIAEVNWICPSVQRLVSSPDFINDRKNWRVDYIACPFDDHPSTPFRWSTQPWFCEKADVHGSGNLLIFSDGSVKDLSQAVR